MRFEEVRGILSQKEVELKKRGIDIETEDSWIELNEFLSGKEGPESLKRAYEYWVFMKIVYEINSNFSGELMYRTSAGTREQEPILIDDQSLWVKPYLSAYDFRKIFESVDLNLLQTPDMLEVRPDFLLSDPRCQSLPWAASHPGWVVNDFSDSKNTFKEFSKNKSMKIIGAVDELDKDIVSKYMWFCLAYEVPVYVLCSKRNNILRASEDFKSDIKTLRESGYVFELPVIHLGNEKEWNEVWIDINS